MHFIEKQNHHTINKHIQVQGINESVMGTVLILKWFLFAEYMYYLFSFPYVPSTFQQIITSRPLWITFLKLCDFCIHVASKLSVLELNRENLNKCL